MQTTIVTAALLSLGAAAANAAAGWHHSLYLGNGDYWRARVQVDVRNDMDREALGEPVALRVGKGVGEADLVGARAEAVRVCDASGTEMLWALAAPDGQAITAGPIPAGSTLTVPVECPAHGDCTYYVYFDNPSAWAVPDFLEASMGVRNGGLEAGRGDVPAGWRHDPQDEQHHAYWVTENPHSGKRCLKTVVAEGAEPTWIATRQSGIHIIGGARYVMRAWVKAESVEGNAGWYIHVGNEQNSMIISPMLNGGAGTYDWKEVSAEFTAPKDANIADLGTVLRGTGTAWFDDVSLECLDGTALHATPAKPERLELREIGAGAPWYDEDPRDDIVWDGRVPVRVYNFSDKAAEAPLIHVDLGMLTARRRGNLKPETIRVTAAGKVVPHYAFGDSLLFEGDLPPRTVTTYYVYFSNDERIKPTARSDYAGLLASPRNLVKNPSFELGRDMPDDWPAGAEGQRPAGTVLGFDEPGLFGERCARMFIPHDSTPAWTGWRQDVPVQPDRTYLFAAWLRCRDLQNGSLQLHAHFRNAAGGLCKTQQMTGAGPPISGTTDWTLMSGTFTMPEDIATFQLHLTMLATGTAWHDGVVLAEVAPGTMGQIEGRTKAEVAGLTVWAVNAVVKLFQDDLPPAAIQPARITAGRNEAEPLQLAVRSPEAVSKVTVQVDPPANGRGARLADVEVNVVGYVPIDHATNYYSSNSPAWHRKFPTSPGACDGWPGMWPDPLLPQTAFDLAANVTQPIWITVHVPKDAAPGDYRGKATLSAGGKSLKEIPFTVHVWDFALPDELHTAAIYDLRIDGRWRVPGQSDEETRRQFCRFMAEHRVCPDGIRPEPVIRYENGKATADFTEFDKAAAYYFDVLKLPHTYTPWYFYCFGWGFPPGEKFGEAPYEGQYPYEGVDRGKLRPEFKAAYQACLKAYWDHMKEKGWDKKCVLYISDEPHDSRPDIRAQMKALCDMIHEVDPSIPIYASTWHYQPEWQGYIDVWGIGHYGIVSPEKMQDLRDAGDRLWFTTDGQMCTDTPYCAVERLLPHYCLKYGVEAYEFWGISWLTYDPYQFGWHAYIHQSGQPGESGWVRYPNGDGFLAYPGEPVGHAGPVSSVRLEQAREGVEDYECLYLLRELAGKAKAAGKDTRQADEALRAADELVTIPNAGGRYSTKILPDPDKVLTLKETVARAIEALQK